EVLVTGGGGALEGLAATLMRSLRAGTPIVPTADAGETVDADEVVEESVAALVEEEPAPAG
ncbi:MAG: hypothetical protein ABL966_13305, partial [Acidimicrobiales bacterium]